MNKKQKVILGDIFATPVKKNIKWSDIEKLVLALGGQITEGNGSRVRFFLNGVIASFHRPHPQKEALPYMVKEVKRFLTNAKAI